MKVTSTVLSKRNHIKDSRLYKSICEDFFKDRQKESVMVEIRMSKVEWEGMGLDEE